MAKYLCTWEPIIERWPSDAKGRMQLGIQLMNQVKKGMQDGWVKDWGAYIGGNGQWILEGEGKEVKQNLTPFNPYFYFDVQEGISLDDMLEMYEAGEITYESAINNSSRPSEMKDRILKNNDSGEYQGLVLV